MSTTTTVGRVAVEDKVKAAGMGEKRESKNYKGFVAGVFSGVGKLTGEFTPTSVLEARIASNWMYSQE
jgi:hypothetical protein